MQKRVLKNRIIALLLACLMLTGFFALQNIRTAYADPEEETATEEVTAEEQDTQEAQEPDPTENGILISSADEEEEEENPMDALLSEDRIWLEKFNKLVINLAAVLGVLIVCVIILTIYVMITRTTRLTKQNKQLSKAKEKRQLHVPVSAMPQTEEQITEFGDTLRIKRAVTQNTQTGHRNARPASANMQRPTAPQRPSRPTQGTAQPGVRRPTYTGQPTRSTAAGGQIRQPQRPTSQQRYGQPVRQTPHRPPAQDGNYRQLHRTPSSSQDAGRMNQNN